MKYRVTIWWLDSSLTSSDYRALSQFRMQIRRFLHFSEAAARAEALEPQQHQLMLAIRSLDEPHGPTVGQIAEHLLIRHHSAVGLIDRLADRGFVERMRGDGDRRQVRIRLTAEGERKLERLSSVHRAELVSSGPLLVKSLGELLELTNYEESEDSSTTNVSAVENRDT